ncbi:(2Fe-2S)-binding protein [Bradyrhizobium septentrionale]|uniref:(2Fe-2S)-binding protein n=1 Tax=Bradyrhizobium septentrionale TaxID=1404411 RepID=A0ABZ2P9V7_9BRAD
MSPRLAHFGLMRRPLQLQRRSAPDHRRDQGGRNSVEAIGRSLKAGTNCGGCKPEIGKLIGATAQPRQATAS